jgi:hypothetical protein
MSTPGAGATPGLSVGGTMPELAILVAMTVAEPWLGFDRALGLPVSTGLAVACAMFTALLFGARLVPAAVEDITTPEGHLARARTAAQEEAVGRVAVPA